MNRFEQIADQLDQYLADQLEQALTSAEAELTANQEVYAGSFQRCLAECISQAGSLQQSGQKGAIKYLAISTLQSSLLTESYQIRMDLQDFQGFIDTAECWAYWVPEFVISFLNLNWKELGALLSPKVLRVKSYELFEIQHTYRSLVFHSLTDLIRKLIQPSAGMLKQLECEPEVLVLYGNYLEKNGYIAKIAVKELADDEIFLHPPT